MIPVPLQTGAGVASALSRPRVAPAPCVGRGNCQKSASRTNETFRYVYKRCFEMRSLNLDQLRTLAAVVKFGSFSAAARHLNLTQPAVSLQGRELEERVGLRLVDRVGKQVRATAAGRDLIAH